MQQVSHQSSGGTGCHLSGGCWWAQVGVGEHSCYAHLLAMAASSACLVWLELYQCPLQSQLLSLDSCVVTGALDLPGREGGLLGREEEGRLLLGPSCH